MSQLSAVLFAIAAIALGRAIQIQNGFYDALGLCWLTVAVVAMAAAIGWRHRRPARWASSWPMTELVLGAGLAWQFLTLVTARPAMYIDFDRPLQRPVFAAGLLAAFALAAAVAAGNRPVRRASFVAALAVFAGLGAWMLRASPDPAIDVVTVHREAIDALTAGRSPYAISFRNIYGGTTTFYGEGITDGDRVLFGLPYPPISLLMALPGAWLAGDYRAGLVAALVVSGALIGFCGRPGSVRPAAERQAMLAALLVLFTPRVFFVLEQGWTEPFVLVLLVLGVFLMSRRERLGAAAAGLLFGVKQYMVVGLPLCWLLLPRGRRLRTAGIAAAVAAIFTLPFLVADPRGMLHSVVMVQLSEPFRLDSLGYLSWMGRHGLEEPHVWITLLAAAVAAGFAGWRLPASPGSFAAGLAFVLVLTFAFGKKAFCNYYFLVIGATCLALAAGFEDVPGSPERDESRATG